MKKLVLVLCGVNSLGAMFVLKQPEAPVAPQGRCVGQALALLSATKDRAYSVHYPHSRPFKYGFGLFGAGAIGAALTSAPAVRSAVVPRGEGYSCWRDPRTWSVVISLLGAVATVGGVLLERRDFRYTVMQENSRLHAVALGLEPQIRDLKESVRIAFLRLEGVDAATRADGEGLREVKRELETQERRLGVAESGATHAERMGKSAESAIEEDRGRLARLAEQLGHDHEALGAALEAAGKIRDIQGTLDSVKALNRELSAKVGQCVAATGQMLPLMQKLAGSVAPRR